jgi:hypothetical protein
VDPGERDQQQHAELRGRVEHVELSGLARQ